MYIVIIIVCIINIVGNDSEMGEKKRLDPHSIDGSDSHTHTHARTHIRTHTQVRRSRGMKETLDLARQVSNNISITVNPPAAVNFGCPALRPSSAGLAPLTHRLCWVIMECWVTDLLNSSEGL